MGIDLKKGGSFLLKVLGEMLLVVKKSVMVAATRQLFDLGLSPPRLNSFVAPCSP